MEKFLRLPLSLHVIIGLGLAFAVGIVGAMVEAEHRFMEAKLLLEIVFMLYLLIYPFAISSALISRASPKISLPQKWYAFNWVVIFIGVMALIIASYIFEQDEFHFQGPFALIGLYFTYAFIYTFLYAARLLKIVEKNEQVSYGESIGLL